MVLDGPINRDAFITRVRQILVPSSHKVPAAREAIEATAATLLFLTPYSPDFNPIEQALSKLKAHLRKAAERTIHGLWDARSPVANLAQQSRRLA